jgi:hypothetical protein
MPLYSPTLPQLLAFLTWDLSVKNKQNKKEKELNGKKSQEKNKGVSCRFHRVDSLNQYVCDV